jgi:rRNA pseudouridine-1189 N-methylase Emg1 (Nep1/Mra1 family)
MKLPKTYDSLIQEVEQLQLYKKLIQQLNKDFLYANIDLDLEEEILPNSLKLILHETVYRLIQEKFADYLNLLYIIDVSEEKIKSLNGDDTLLLSEEVSFLILQREWQKVWFKNKYSK